MKKTFLLISLVAAALLISTRAAAAVAQIRTMPKRLSRERRVLSTDDSSCSRRCGKAGHRRAAEAGWEHQPFLRSGDSQIDTPTIHAEIDAGNGADAVYVEHRRMRGSIDRAPYRRNVTCHPCRGLVVNDQHAFDRVRLVRPQRFLDALWRSAGPPFLVLQQSRAAPSFRFTCHPRFPHDLARIIHNADACFLDRDIQSSKIVLLRFSFRCLRPQIRTSFHHQPEAQHPISSAIHKLVARLPYLLAPIFCSSNCEWRASR
jgi:hypothetical protein